MLTLCLLHKTSTATATQSKGLQNQRPKQKVAEPTETVTKKHIAKGSRKGNDAVNTLAGRLFIKHLC